ncbi:MAG: hypothetical protein ACRBB6_16430, partial [Neptuniibacter sp.]
CVLSSEARIISTSLSESTGNFKKNEKRSIHLICTQKVVHFMCRHKQKRRYTAALYNIFTIQAAKRYTYLYTFTPAR